MNASRRRFDSLTKRKRNRATSRRLSPASAFGRRPRPVARLRLPRRRRIVPPPNPPVPPPTPKPNTRTHNNTHGLQRTSSTEDDSMSPTRDKKYDRLRSIYLTYTTHRYPHHTHSANTRVRTYGDRPSAPTRPTTDDDAFVVRSPPRRAFVRSIDRSDASIAIATGSVRRARARGDVEEEERGVVVVAVVPIERPRDRPTRA